MASEPVFGAYERLIDRQLRAALAGLDDASVDERLLADAEAPDRLAAFVAGHVRDALHRSPSPADRLTLTQAILSQLPEPTEVAEPASLLTRIGPSLLPGEEPPAPALIPLADSDLLVNGAGEPGIGETLRHELATADRVDLIIAFIRFTGLRMLLRPLRQLAERGVPIRVITTTYLGSTEQRALDELVRLGAEVRVSYDTRSTRLHAKSWVLHRETGYSTAYIGSSNLSKAALLDGLEWNVRLAQAHAPVVVEKIAATFESYWADPEFELYDADDPARFVAAIAAEKRGTYDAPPLELSGLDIRPYPYQREILEALDVERRRHDRWRNLVVAPTGTGKTVVAALDYARLVEQAPELGRQPTLLFVAHRKELLQQSLRTFREVLRDADFGELYVGGERPRAWTHVFASVQSLATLPTDQLPADRFDVVLVDEFHHAEAATYRKLLDHLQPRVLVGMTATPERTDGLDVTRWFDGRFAFEMRLWDALDQRLLAPFHYFGVADDVDLRDLTWRRGGYAVDELSKVLTGDDVRVRRILSAIDEHIADPGSMRALAFCVSIEHARFMATKFEEAGLTATAVTATTPTSERADALRRLAAGEVQVLCTVDLFNEGVDVPSIDTVLFLRPTESATVFLQQLGRGLRKTAHKPCLTVLDFVGQQHRDFRFDLRLRALTGRSRRQLVDDVTDGFPYLPAGCHLQLDRKVERVILEQLQRRLKVTTKSLIIELQRLRAERGEVDLPTFLNEAGLELEDVYKPTIGGWTRLQRAAGVPLHSAGPNEAAIGKRLRNLLHLDDRDRTAALAALAAHLAGGPAPAQHDVRRRRIVTMVVAALVDEATVHDDLAAGLAVLRAEPALADELGTLAAMLEDAAPRLAPQLADPAEVPLALHARYLRNEIAQAFRLRGKGWITGVRYDEATTTDLLLVTLEKVESHYTPTTMYEDYVISRDRFHWQSQSGTSRHSGAGPRYLGGASRVLLFVRRNRDEPYLFLGRCDLESAEGDRPISIVWKLRHPVPEDWFQTARRIAG